MVTIDFDKSAGLVPVIVQEHGSNDILMLAYMNKEAFEMSVKTGEAHYFSRSKNRYWKKGESSGHTQIIKEVRLDCDSDTILLSVIQNGGAACHKGYKSCFYRVFDENKQEFIIDKNPIFDPEQVYGK